MELEFIDISQHGEEKRTSGSRNYVSGSVVRAERPAVRNSYRDKRPAPGRSQGQRRPVSGSRTRRAEPQRVRRTPEEIERRRQMILAKKKRQRQRRMIKGIILLCETAFIVLLCLLLYQLIRSFGTDQKEAESVISKNQEAVKAVQENQSSKPLITEDFLTVNPYSRPGEKLEDVNNIFVHYTANKGTSAAQNRSYFENLGVTGETSASAHFIIGYDGEIIQCVPLDEIAYAVMGRNYDSISIECCYQDDDGEFTYATYRSLIRLCAWLLNEYDLSPSDMRRHYDEGGKKCPLYFVEHEGAWEQFIEDLTDYILEKEEPAV
ncbi:MAG: N-acetylmuramoyl-L-alanine amidase [Lachnospiraceae bacterium]|nr:N-acetylmuramoyl-L-alanine amidase [Lachnospiraceae bacterium]